MAYKILKKTTKTEAKRNLKTKTDSTEYFSEAKVYRPLLSSRFREILIEMIKN